MVNKDLKSRNDSSVFRFKERNRVKDGFKDDENTEKESEGTEEQQEK